MIWALPYSLFKLMVSQNCSAGSGTGSGSGSRQDETKTDDKKERRTQEDDNEC